MQTGGVERGLNAGRHDEELPAGIATADKELLGQQGPEKGLSHCSSMKNADLMRRSTGQIGSAKIFTKDNGKAAVGHSWTPEDLYSHST